MTVDAAPEPEWGTALRGLVERILGPEHPPVTFDTSSEQEHSFTYRAADGTLTVEATDAVAAAVGLHTYLREVCAVTVARGVRLPLPVTAFPDALPTSRTAEVDQVYHLNFCTTGYTSPYWGWAEWEQEIDWMALHGVNTPLTVVGHEAVLRDAYIRLGLTDEQVRAFIGGPGYLPWHYMGNLDHFAGPIPSSWIDTHLDLGRRILRRQRSLGMTPVLPGFTGHVPPTLVSEHTRARNWQGLTTHVLDPADPRYPDFTERIARSQAELLGTDHLYAIDPFIEMVPVDTDPAFPGSVARATLEGLLRVDPEAVWVLQSWPFSYQSEFWSDARVPAFLDAVPDERLLLLDLYAERKPQWTRFDSYGDKSWMWCALLNFGGRTDPMADLQGTLDRINAAKQARNRPVGIGLTMEATHNNPAFYDLVVDQAWTRTQNVERDWLPGFVERRYGCGHDPALLTGWRGLLSTLYALPDTFRYPADQYGVLWQRPHYLDLADPGGLRERVNSRVWYPWPDLLGAWEQLVAAAERSPDLAEGPLGRDLIDVAQAVLLRVADHRHLNLVERAVEEGAVPRKDVDGFLKVFDDLDTLVATRPECHYRRWEEQAAAWAENPEDRRVLVDNARRILTVWTVPGDGELDDYAGRLWAGLVGDYYRSRWELWCQDLEGAVTDPAGAGERLDRALLRREEEFLAHGVSNPPVVGGDVVVRSRALLERHGHSERP